VRYPWAAAGSTSLRRALQGRGFAAASAWSVRGCGRGALQQGIVDHGDDGGASMLTKCSTKCFKGAKLTRSKVWWSYAKQNR
jgi:hypothetical protein